MTAVELSNLDRPIFRFMPDTNHEVTLEGEPSLSGDAPFLVPFRLANADYTERRPIVYSILNSWSIDIDTATINLTTRVGGRVDGLSLTADIYYLIWAFMDEFQNFKGLGITALPRVTGASTSSGGTLGATATFSVTAGHGWRFVVGARLLVRQGTDMRVSPATTGDPYNQGIITGVTANSITATMDALYTEIDYEENTTLASLTGLEIVQLDRFEPRMWNQDSLYPGSGAEHQFAYLGSIQTNASSNIQFFRKRGENVMFDDEAYIVWDLTSTSSSEDRVCLSRWLPRSAGWAHGIVTVSGVNVNSYVHCQTDPIAGLWGFTGSRAAGGGLSRANYNAIVRNVNNSLTYELYVSGGTSTTGEAFLSGYEEDRF
jgi:hypothetical protein